MAKKTSKKADPYRIVKRSDGRHMVQKRGGGFINGPEKAKILAEKGLVKVSKSTKKPEAAEGEGAPAEG